MEPDKKDVFMVTPWVRAYVRRAFAINAVVRLVGLLLGAYLLGQGQYVWGAVTMALAGASLATTFFSPALAEMLCVDEKALWLENAWWRGRKCPRGDVSEIRVVFRKKPFAKSAIPYASIVDNTGRIRLSAPVFLLDRGAFLRLSETLGVPLVGLGPGTPG